MAVAIGNLITLDGQFTDWPAADAVTTPANTVAGYQVYGALLNDATLGQNYVIGIDATVTTDPVIAANTFIYLNTDQNTATGFSPFGNVGAEYYVQFSPDSNGVLEPYLYSVTSAGVATELNGGAPLNFGISSNGESVELAVPQTLLTPSGGTAPTSINFTALIDNGAAALPGDFTNSPQYAITDPSVTPVKIANLITLDGQFSDWPAADVVMTPVNTVAGYQLYGALLNDATLGKNYVIGIDATVSTDPVIAANTFIYLNTDQNSATGYSPFGSVGAEYYVQFSPDSNGVLEPFLYSVTSAGVATLLNGGAPLNFGVSSNGESVELAIPQALLTPSGGVAPTSINFTALVNNGAVALPSDFTNPPQYAITDPSTLGTVNSSIKKVGIVYSATTAALYFGGGEAGETAYADLFMAAQHQAEAAGVSYDLLSEADLTNVAKLSQYSALIFPDMEDVQSSQVSAIASALNQVVYDYHVPIITAGNFMTNDQTGAALPGNSYANMQALLNVTLSATGTATYSVTPDATALADHNPVIAGYTAGELIGGASGQFAGTTAGYYTNTGYQTFSGSSQPATTLADINIQGGASVPGVVQTTTGGTNTVFATTGLLGDSNLLQHAIQNAVFGTTPSLSLDITRMAGVVDSRTDMDQSQFPSDVSPGNGQPGIYDALIPILQQWKQEYNFVGSYYINIGDDANPSNDNSTNWSVSAPYYKAIIALGSEIGNHSYTHLINPPTVDANGNPVPVDSTGTSTWDENTNTLYVTPPANGSAPNWTFNYEFGQSKTIEEQNLGITIAGAAVPGANDTISTSQQIEQYYQTVAGGLTGYVNGGWTGVGSGAPNAFGYISPTDTGSVYIAPNITFDFTEIQYDNKTAAEALSDWETLFNQLSADSETPVIVWPWHDYGPTDWDTNGSGGAGAGPGYTEQMYTDFIAYAYNAGYEFVTSEDLAARIAAQQKATLSETTNGNVITATITPDPTAPDLGAMALNVINGAAGQVIQNAGNWYAYDIDSIFLPYGGGTFNVTLGTTQDDVTHIDSLPMRADLQSVTGDGSNLTFSMTGDGVVDIHVKTPGTNIVSIQGAPAATLTGDDLSLTFNDGALAVSPTSPQGAPVLHTVTISDGTSAVLSSGTNILFGGSGTNVLALTGLYENYTDTLNADGSDTVVDTRAGTPDGTDIAYNFQDFQFADGLVLTAAQFAGTGILVGTSAADVLSSPLAGEVILGLAGNDTLTAGAVNQVLDGGTGTNVLSDNGFAGVTLIGDGGNDTFVVNNAATKVLEMPNSGSVTVETNLATYVLPNNVEDLVYTGSSGINVTGNALNDTFSGFTGISTIDGGAGINTAVFSGQFAQYTETTNTDGTVTFVDTRAGSPDGTTTFRNVEFFHFTDETIGPIETVIQTNGSTSLTAILQNYVLYDNGVGPELQYGGVPVTAGEFGAWVPIGAIQTAGGYEVAWSLPGGNQYSIWTTDSAGNFVSQVPGLTGTSPALEAAESVFGQDLNGDGTIGPTKTVIHTDGSTSLTGFGLNYFLYNNVGVGPELQYGGAAVTAGEFGAWVPIGAIQTAGGYEVAWSLPGGNQYSIWTTDSSGNFVSQVPGLTGTSPALETAESVFGQDLNGDGTIGPTKTVIQTNGSTSLNQIANEFFLDNAGVGPELQYGGAAVTAGEFGTWAPIGAIQTAGGGYEVVWSLPGGNQYSIWTTDSSGNFVSQVVGLTGTSYALEAAESVLGQDLNGDGTIGLVKTLVQTDGSTSLNQIANEFFLDDNSGVGPALQYGGAPATVGEFGAWTPIGAVQTSGGYEVVWSLPGGNQYSIWTTDSSGNFVSQVVGLTGNSYALEAAESVLGQDLNGDGTIGLVKTLIQTDGSTSLNQIANEFFLDDNSGVGPALQYGGAPATVGEFGAWTPIGAVQTSGGYEVVWSLPGSDQYSIWTTDSSGNFVSQVDGLKGASPALETAESVLGQDLNGDGVIGSSATIASGATLELTAADSVAVHFNGSTGTLILDHSSAFAGQISGLSGSDQIDLKDIAFGTGTTVAYTGTPTGGVLTVSDAQGHTANIALAGDYTDSTFALSSDGSGGTTVIDPPKQALAGSTATFIDEDSAGAQMTAVSTGAQIIGLGGSGNVVTVVPIDGAGNTTLTGGAGADTFVFAPVNPTTTNGIYNAGFGKEVITDFMANPQDPSHDVLQFSSSMFAANTTATGLVNGTAHNVAGGPVTVAQSGANVLITLDPTDSITLNNVALATLKAGAAADIHFV